MRFIYVYKIIIILFLWCKAEFLASLLQSSVSHDPSEIILTYWFAAQETFILIIYVENRSATSYYCGNWDIQSKIIAFIWNVNHL